MEIVTQIIPLLSGPSSAVIVLLLTYWVLVKRGLPIFEKLLSRRDSEFVMLLSAHEKDRAAFLKTMETIDKRLDSLSSEFKTMTKEVAVMNVTVTKLRKEVLKCVTHPKEIEE